MSFVKVSVLLAVCLTVVSGLPWVPEAKTDNGWVDRHNRNVNNTLGNAANVHVLFYGDSITQGWEGAGRSVFDQYYLPLGTANYGISGDRTEHLLYRMRDGEVTSSLNPNVCVIKIGTNNLSGGHAEQAVALGVVFNVNELRERLPNMKILLLGVLPRTNEEWTQKTSAVNDIIKHLDNGNTVRFLDMKDHFYRGGNNFVSELYTNDLLHLSEAGYRKWAEVMDPLFREMMNSTMYY